MKITCSAKIEEGPAQKAELLAGRFGITRSQLIGWFVERGVTELEARLDALDAAGYDLSGLPPGIPQEVMP